MQEERDQDLFEETRKFTRRFKLHEQKLEVTKLNDTSHLLKELSEKPPHKYETTGVIAYGGMKLISRLLDKDTHREVAQATLLNPDSDMVTLGKFIREARITANLQHPNIIPIYDIGVEQNHPYFTMKLIDGETLLDITGHLKRKRKEYVEKYKLYDLLRIFRQVINAIIFAHSRGVIHLDLSPGNIVVGRFGEVLVLDWGMAKVVSEHDLHQDKCNDPVFSPQNNIQDVLAQGTPGFMAPEQVRAEFEKYTIQTDIYALGAILYHILTYTLPIEGNSVQEILFNTAQGNIVEPRHRINTPIPSALSAVIMKAMHPSPEERYESARELRNEIDAYLEGRATHAQRASMFTHFWLFCKRNWIVFLLCFTILGLLSAYGIHQLLNEKWAIGHWSAPIYNFNAKDANTDWTKFTFSNEFNIESKDLFIFKNDALEIPPHCTTWFSTLLFPGDLRMRVTTKGQNNFYILWGCSNTQRPENALFPAGCVIAFEGNDIWVGSSPYTTSVPSQLIYKPGALKSFFANSDKNRNIVIQEMNRKIKIFNNNIEILSIENPYPLPPNPQYGIMAGTQNVELQNIMIRSISPEAKSGPYLLPELYMTQNQPKKAFEAYLYIARYSSDENRKLFALRCAMNTILYRSNMIPAPLIKLDEVLKLFPSPAPLTLEDEFYAVKSELFWQFGKFTDAIRMIKLIQEKELKVKISEKLLDYNFDIPHPIKDELFRFMESNK